MGELFEKLRRRREQVDEGGLHFESKPSERTAEASGADGPGRRASNELVFESKPSEQTADCRAGAISFDKSRSAPARSAPQRVPCDFRSAIDRQRSHVDEKGLKWTSAPEESQDEALRREAEHHEAGRRAMAEAERKAKEEAELKAREEAEQKAREDAEQKAREEEERQAAEEAAQEAAEEEHTEEGKVDVKGKSVKWRVGLTNFPRIEEFESPAFHLGDYGPVHLRLRGTGDECQLSLHAEGARPSGARAKLWLSKGWAKVKPDREWRDGDDMLTTFHVSLVGRPSILCGIVYHIP
mmetsp:Transcript_12928/g.34418  ORF Transcript_12928/g.34418 Transcript_12928/m.34418 type:complete len:297 (+) Transcript_12928:79-969(+)